MTSPLPQLSRSRRRPTLRVLIRRLRSRSQLRQIQMSPNGEIVTFYDGKTNLGPGATANGVASLTTSFSKAKTHTIKARYPGDAFHKASSGTVDQVVNP